MSEQGVAGEPGSAGAGLGGAKETGPEAGAGGTGVSDGGEAPDETDAPTAGDGPAGPMDSSGGDLNEAGVG